MTRRIETVEALDALAVGSVVLGTGDEVYERHDSDHVRFCWFMTGLEEGSLSQDIGLPATLLHDPSAPVDTPASGGDVDEAGRLSQVHADALATLDVVADRMDEFAYQELHSALEDGVLLRDEDGQPKHKGRTPELVVTREAVEGALTDPAYQEAVSTEGTTALEVMAAVLAALGATVAERMDEPAYDEMHGILDGETSLAGDV